MLCTKLIKTLFMYALVATAKMISELATTPPILQKVVCFIDLEPHQNTHLFILLILWQIIVLDL